MSDEQVQEFNLDGKQLAFVVIAGIAVAVVVFLCGVMVGRGVRAPQTSGTVALGDSAFDPSAPPELVSDDVSAPAEAPLALPNEDLRNLDRLSEPAPRDTIRTPAAEAPPPPPPAPVPSAVAPARIDAAFREPPGRGYVVQVMALTKVEEAVEVARGLEKKGYPSFVQETSQVGHRFRVRLGKYASRTEALAVAARLKREEQFKDPWVDESR